MSMKKYAAAARRLVPAIFFWIPWLAPVSYGLVNAPMPTALRLLAGTGRKLSRKITQKQPR